MSTSLVWKPAGNDLWLEDRDLIWSAVMDDFNEVFSSFFGNSKVYTDRLVSRAYPKMDIYQDKNDLVIEAVLPFVKKEDVSIQIVLNPEATSQYILTLSGRVEDSKAKGTEGSNFCVRELRRGTFKRNVMLRKEIVDKCPTPKATMENGVLTLRFAKVFEPDPAKQPKQIPIE